MCNLKRKRSMMLIIMVLTMMINMAFPASVSAGGEEPPTEKTPPTEEVEVPPVEEPVVEETEKAPPVEELEGVLPDPQVTVESIEEEVPPVEEPIVEVTEEAPPVEELEGGLPDPQVTVESIGEEAPADDIIPEGEAPADEGLSEVALAETIDAVNEAGMVLVDETGEQLSMASAEAAELLANGDPWFDAGGGVVVGYTFAGVGCAAGVTECHEVANPIQTALDDSRSNGVTINIEAGDYSALDVFFNRPIDFSLAGDLEVASITLGQLSNDTTLAGSEISWVGGGVLSSMNIFVQDGASIQDGITLADDGGTVNVGAGTYNETIEITNNNLTIQSVSGNPADTIIQADAKNKNVVEITSSSNVTFSGFTVKGSEAVSDAAVWGVYMDDASSCLLSDIDITEIESTAGNNGGLFLDDTTNPNDNNAFNNITISDISGPSNVYGLIVRSGDGNSFTNTDISNITGGSVEAISFNWASNSTFESTTIYDIGDAFTTQAIGFYIYGVRSEADNNTFTDTDINNITAVGSASGINQWAYVAENTFTATTISNITSQTSDAFGIFAFGYNNDNTYDNTEISHVTASVRVALGIYFNFPGNSGNVFDTTTITDIEGQIGAAGIYLYKKDSNNVFTSTDISNVIASDGDSCGIKLKYDVTGNSFTGGSITGAKYGVYLLGSANYGDASNNSIHLTNIVGNTEYGVLNDNLAASFNTTNNWWGDASGPSGQGPGSGDAISVNVDYAPWLAADPNAPTDDGAVDAPPSAPPPPPEPKPEPEPQVIITTTDDSGITTIATLNADESVTFELDAETSDEFKKEAKQEAREAINNLEGLSDEEKEQVLSFVEDLIDEPADLVVEIPANVASVGSHINLLGADAGDLPAELEDAVFLGAMLTLEGVDALGAEIEEFFEEVTISFTLPEGLTIPTGMNLAIQYYDEATGEWVTIPLIIEGGVAFANITSLGTYALVLV